MYANYVNAQRHLWVLVYSTCLEFVNGGPLGRGSTASICCGCRVPGTFEQESSGEKGPPDQGTGPGEPGKAGCRRCGVTSLGSRERQEERPEKRGGRDQKASDSWVKNLSFILKSVWNHCNIFAWFCFVSEEQPLEVLSFQKLKRGSKRKLRKHGVTWERTRD